MCLYHYKAPEECKHTHAISYDDLYSVVLEKIRQTAKLFKDDEKFFKMLNKKAGQNSKADTLNGQKTKHEKRLAELSNLLRKLFEKNAAGLLDDNNYALFSKDYQAEQADIMVKLQTVNAELLRTDDYRQNAEKLRETVCEHLVIKKLTPFIVAKLIYKIIVGHKQTVDGEETQEITIVWRFAGEL